jgi:hypothetical protein
MFPVSDSNQALAEAGQSMKKEVAAIQAFCELFSKTISGPSSN